VARRIERKARENRTSLNRAVIALLDEKDLRPRANKGRVRNLSLLVGSWTREEARAFDAYLAAQRMIDPEIRK
jgi:hypothetical protein